MSTVLVGVAGNIRIAVEEGCSCACIERHVQGAYLKVWFCVSGERNPDRVKGGYMQMPLMLKMMSGEPGIIDINQTGKRIKEVCGLKGITVKTIQKELYIGSFQSVYAWFSGKAMPSLDNMYRLSRLLGVPMENLIVDAAKDVWVLLEEWVKNTGLEKRVQIYYGRVAKTAG